MAELFVVAIILVPVSWWISIGILCSWVASEKGRSAGLWFFIGLSVNVFALIAIAGMPKVEGSPTGAEKRAARVKVVWSRTGLDTGAAAKGKQWRSNRLGSWSGPKPEITSGPKKSKDACTQCNGLVPAGSSFCPHCGSRTGLPR